MKKRIHAYTVNWRDSCSLRGWQRLNDPDHTESVISSVGWVIKETKTEVTLTTSVSGHGSVMDALTIPREAITKMTRLKYHIAVDD